MIKKGLKCPECGDKIFSYYRHDWKTCKCGLIFIDSGDDYCHAGMLKESKFTPSDIKSVEEESDG